MVDIKKLLGYLAASWGLVGFSAIIISAILRLWVYVEEISLESVGAFEICFAVIFTGFMLYAEGFRGFHKKLAPRFASRAKYLSENLNFIRILLAPFFCVGYFEARKSRIIVSFLMTIMIIGFVLIVRQFSQPWRGLIDIGVIAGLVLGLISMLYFFVSVIFLGKEAADPEMPDVSSR